ncbi:hypothetical protein [Ohtaekwangia sp.]|uniref:hypothetical protein n=1 Tax=Ohtaekwangia sp. TaxID=2066019 RepID=UPI002F94A72A
MSCFLLSLMVMNSIGYYSFLVHVRDQIAIAMERKIQTNLNEPGANLIIKLPISTLYQPDSDKYEPVSGHFTYKGKVYQTIKRNIHQDTLYLECIHDYRTTEADNRISDFARSFAGDDQHGAFKLIVSLGKYYFSMPHTLQHTHNGWVMKCEYGEYPVRDEQELTSHIFHPPRLIS